MLASDGGRAQGRGGRPEKGERAPPRRCQALQVCIAFLYSKYVSCIAAWTRSCSCKRSVSSLGPTTPCLVSRQGVVVRFARKQGGNQHSAYFGPSQLHYRGFSCNKTVSDYLESILDSATARPCGEGPQDRLPSLTPRGVKRGGPLLFVCVHMCIRLSHRMHLPSDEAYRELELKVKAMKKEARGVARATDASAPPPPPPSLL